MSIASPPTYWKINPAPTVQRLVIFPALLFCRLEHLRPMSLMSGGRLIEKLRGNLPLSSGLHNFCASHANTGLVLRERCFESRPFMVEIMLRLAIARNVSRVASKTAGCPSSWLKTALLNSWVIASERTESSNTTRFSQQSANYLRRS